LALIAAQELGNETPEKAAEDVNTRFVSNSEMLEEFFLIRVSDAGMIESLPMVIKEYSPDYDKLPLFLYNATFSVDWENEQPFLKSFINALATLYTLEPPLPDDPQNAKEAYRLVAEHRIFPSFKESSFWAPNMLLTENAVVQLADLPDLYRIFERC
ncbi:DNA mismatch repair protein, partial [Coemansia sp. RSA 2559]